MSGDADWVAHVVQAVEEADQVEGARTGLGVGHCEGSALGYACLGGSAPRDLDRRLVVVKPRCLGPGKRMGKHHGGRAVAAAHVGDACARLELGGHAVEGLDPAGQLGAVAGAKEPLGPGEQAG
jgi:hypothetical protein